MVILDVFEHNGKTAVYCKADTKVRKITSKKAEINGMCYDILKADVMRSISGDIAITLLLNTNEKISVQQTVKLN